MSGHTCGRAVLTAGLPDPADPAAVGERGDAALERLAADRVDDEVDAPAVGEALTSRTTSAVA